MPLDLPGRQGPHWLEPGGIVGRDLRERAVAPAIVSAAVHQPVAVFRLLEPIGGYRLIVLQNRRYRRWGIGFREWRRRPLRQDRSSRQHKRNPTRRNGQ